MRAYNSLLSYASAQHGRQVGQAGGLRLQFSVELCEKYMVPNRELQTVNCSPTAYNSLLSYAPLPSRRDVDRHEVSYNSLLSYARAESPSSTQEWTSRSLTILC